jgi:crotonobetainyl-CoA:carnitine CoA-transferase CaiB-like acyl-CoA transferase
LRELIESKMKGLPIKPREISTPAPVIDLMAALNSRLVYVSISGVGESGPYAKKRVYDPIIEALSGFADIQSDAKTRRPQMIRTIVADKTTAIFAAQAITAALYRRRRYCGAAT